MSLYKEWENEMAARIKSVNSRADLEKEDKMILKDRAIQPFGLWTPSSNGNGNGKTQNPNWREGPCTPDQVDFITKHMSGKISVNILKFLNGRFPSDLKKGEAHDLIDMITKKKEWPQ